MCNNPVDGKLNGGRETCRRKEGVETYFEMPFRTILFQSSDYRCTRRNLGVAVG